ncbi:hypothetical protein [Paraburkholderia acidipaludis]|uniref:hypothetical protein n=1 Tax=Paraburkholderia acidipaludis TaxID=660537 RepID=UPI0012EC6686|nr:hypothetical protein [Paraburkholderia acidipaludis]
MNSTHTSCREVRATQTIARLYEAEAEQHSSYCPVRVANIQRWAKYLEKLAEKANKRKQTSDAVLWRLHASVFLAT